MGESGKQGFQLSFNRFLRVGFQGSRVTSNGGLILVRELDERLGFSELIDEHLTDSRANNARFSFADLLRQSVYSRLAGYEDVNDAKQLSRDPTFRLIGSEKTWERGAALPSRLQTFETDLLAEDGNFPGLARVNRELIGKVEAFQWHYRAVLDMDATEIPVYGEQEQSAYNGHFESTCYHPLLLFNLVKDALPGEKPRALGNFAGQLWAFALAMQEDDFVVLPRKLTSQIAIGQVTGPYRYDQVNTAFRHTRPVEWLRPDVPRATFEQDLLNSFGAFMTVCNISRNDADRRVAAVLEGNPDPGPLVRWEEPTKAPVPTEVKTAEVPDLAQLAHDQIVAQIQSRFAGHALARLVDAVLQADGWMTRISVPGPDGGVDILAGRGPLGLDAPRLCVQVKSQNSPADVTVYRTLQGTMQTFKAEQGLLVCWGGFNKVVLAESRQGHFMVRLWDSRDLVGAIYRNYERLPAEIQAELPLKRVWMLVAEEPAE